jgi:pimeloyl-ACP methyl ester carboxylesterase
MDNDVMAAPGELVAANGSRYHVRRFGGEAGPVILLEAGLTMMSGCWGWLGPELGRFGQAIAYDRAGLGWSEECEGLRDARQAAAELRGLLEVLQVRPPVILLGHSMGAMLNRGFLRENRGFASAVIWLDPAHPDVAPRSRRMRTFLFFLEFAHLLAARNLPSITLQIARHLKALPAQEYRALKWFLKNSRHLKNSAREARAWKLSADYVREVRLGETPLLMITAQKNALGGWADYQRELALLSTRTKHVTYTDVSHISMLAERAHAVRVAAEIRGFLEALSL